MKLFELIKLKPNFSYHGTSSVRVKEIESKGFDLNKIGEKSDTKLSGVSTTIDKTVAEEHAEWAVEKFGGSPMILKIDLSSLKIMSGKEVNSLWEKQGSMESALRIARKNFDGAELFDRDEEFGLEEFEILIFDPKKVKIL